MKGLGQLAIGIFTLVYSWGKLGLAVSAGKILLLIVEILSASLFMIAIMNIAASVCFWVHNSGFVMVMSFRFTDYARYPANIYSKVFRFIFTYIIPIAFISYYPSLFFMQPGNVPMLSYLTPVFGVLFFYLSYRIWMRGAMQYSGTGN